MARRASKLLFMFRIFSPTWLLLLLWYTVVGNTVSAAPKVVVDIAPLHSLVSAVMGGHGSPSLLMPANASPHHYALRPSEAAMLENASFVFWMSHDLTPWLARGLKVLAQGATSIEMLNHEETLRLPLREGAAVDTHVHGAIDPHAWLDPVNAERWLHVIATALAEGDPAYAAHYLANAEKTAAALKQHIDQWDALLSSVRNQRYIVVHDSYQYFENRFSLPVAAAVTDAEGAAPGAARIEQLQRVIRDSGARCLFTSPQMSAAQIRQFSGASDIRVAALDPLGIGLTPGPSLYIALLDSIADTMADCLR